MEFNRQLFKEAYKLGYKKALIDNRLETLNERWYSNSTLYTIESSRIISKWLKETIKEVPLPTILPEFPTGIMNPKKDHDYMLRYIAACVQQPINQSITVDFKHPVKGVEVNFIFLVKDSVKEIITTGGTHGDNGVTDMVKIELPLGRFEEIYKKLEGGYQCYSDAEDFITDISMTLAHELTHSVQNITSTNFTNDILKLKQFETHEYAKEIAYFLYFVGRNELQSIQSEAYKLYRKDGSGLIPHNTGVKKRFIRCLVTAILRRFKEYREELQAYNSGEKSLLELIESLPECNAKLLLLWIVFVIAPDGKLGRYDDLVRNDPDYKLKDNFNLNLIIDNVKNLRGAFLQFRKNEWLEVLFIDSCFGTKTREESESFLAHIFSTNDYNKYVLNNIKKWVRGKKNLHNKRLQ